MTYDEAQEVLRKARNKIKPGEFISNRTPPIKQNRADADSREDLDATYPLDADDPCAKHCDAVADAALSAQFAKSADDREAHLSKALECIDAACRAHEALKKGQKS